MLPFHILRSGRIDKLPEGSFVLAASNLPSPIFIATGFEGDPWAIFRASEGWEFDALHHFGGEGLWAEDVTFEFEPTSYVSLTSKRPPVGSLIFAKGEIAISLPVNIGTISGRVGAYDQREGDRDCAFTNWRVVKITDDETYILWEPGSSPAT